MNTYFKHYFIFFNVNEHLVVPVVELIISKSRVGISVSFIYTGLLVRSYAVTQV